MNCSHELNQLLSQCHHDELEEERCHLWYRRKGIGSARSSPDSRWRRFINVTAVRKSDRSLIGAFLPDLFSVRSFKFLRGWAVGVVFLCQLIHGDALLLGPANFELRITIFWISLETIANSINILFGKSLPRVMGHEMLLLCVGFSVPSTVGSHLLVDVVRDGSRH